MLENVKGSAPKSMGVSRDENWRPPRRVFRYHMVKWVASYFHDGSILNIRLADEGEFSKLIAMTTESKRQFRKKHGLP